MTRGDRDTKKRAQQIKAQHGVKYTEALRLAKQDEASSGENLPDIVDGLHRHLSATAKPHMEWINAGNGQTLWLHYDHPTQGILDICTLIMRGDSMIIKPSKPMHRYRVPSKGDLSLLEYLDNQLSLKLPEGGISRMVANELHIEFPSLVSIDDLREVIDALHKTLEDRAEQMPSGRIKGSTLSTGVTGNQVLDHMKSGMETPLNFNGWTKFFTISPSPYLLAMDGTDMAEVEKLRTVDQLLSTHMGESESQNWAPWEGVPLVVMLDCTSGDEYMDSKVIKRVLRNPDSGVFIHAFTSRSAGELRHPTTAMFPA